MSKFDKRNLGLPDRVKAAEMDPVLRSDILSMIRGRTMLKETCRRLYADNTQLRSQLGKPPLISEKGGE